MYVPAVLELDLADLKTIPAKAEAAISIYDDIDILVNNAGIFNRGTILDTIMEVDQQVMNVNYFGTLALTKGFLILYILKVYHKRFCKLL